MSTGYQILAESLKSQKLEYCFGIVGIPVIELGMAIQGCGINFYGFRNEQGAAYAAGAIGYLTKSPGICLAVSGPGMTNCISGMANAQVNGWPMLCISGASDLNQSEKMAFQEIDQVQLAKPVCKFACQIKQIQLIPFLVEKAVRISVSGRPGAVYLDLPGDILNSVYQDQIPMMLRYDTEIQCLASNEQIKKTVQIIKNAKRPLVIVGKGAAYCRAEKEITQLINETNLLFIPTPMGKGVVSDFHNNCMIAARSKVLQKSDVILLIGARLNWILHFGQEPRFSKNVQIIQIDIQPEEFGNNNQNNIPLMGDIKSVVKQLSSEFQNQKFQYDQKLWRDQELDLKLKENKQQQAELENQEQLQYYSAYKIICQVLPKDYILIGEGANTMDIGRTIINHELPRHRLDAGTFGTMGVGIPFALAAKAFAGDSKLVVAIMGDSAFGFSAMEIDTCIRFKLSMLIIILNNNGIYSGVEELPKISQEIPVTALNPEGRYDRMCEALGGKGFYVKNQQELQQSLKQALQEVKKGFVCVVNVAIDPYGARKPQEHQWLTRDSKL